MKNFNVYYPPEPNRRGTAYVMVLVVSMIVTVIGVSSLTINRVRSRIATRTNDWVQAQQLALSAVEQATAVLAETPNWRTVYQHNVIAMQMNWGPGSFNWKLLDEADADLANNLTDPVTIVAVATVGAASYTFSATVDPPGT